MYLFFKASLSFTANKTRLHMKGFDYGHALKKRHKTTRRKWPIAFSLTIKAKPCAQFFP